MIFPLLAPERADEFQLRVSKARLAMSDAGVDALLVASTVNIFYLTGGVCRGYVYLPVEGEPLFFVIPPAAPSAPVMRAIRKPEQIPGMLEAEGYTLPERVGLEFDDLLYSDVERLRKVFPASEVRDGSTPLRAARLTKTPLEISMMKTDGMKQCAVYSRIDRCYEEDMTDLEFQIEIERLLRLEGNLGFLRVSGNLMEINLGSVIAGANADVPGPYDFAMGGAGVSPALPCGACGEIMRVGETVMVDVNGCFNGYQTDMTRVWSIGEITPPAMNAHECSRRILRELEKMALPGVEVCALYAKAEEIVADAKLEPYFMGHNQHAPFIGHGVGIELNETPAITPRCKDKLKDGMTLAIEPKFVIPGVGAVGVENTYVVRADGLENLTPFPEEIGSLL